MTIRQYYPCKKLIQWLLLEHRKSIWKINQKITYNNFLPHSKIFINKWIEDHLHGPTKLMMAETMKSITSPKTLESKYKEFQPSLWLIIDDHTIREQVELDLFFGLNPDEISKRLNNIIKPRTIDRRAVKQFQYFFWNLEDDKGIFRPAIVIELISKNQKLSREYGHILKYSNDKRGREKYMYDYHMYNPEEPNLKNIIKVIDRTTFNQLDALDESNVDKLETHTNIQFKNCIALKTLKTIPNNSSKGDYSCTVDFEDEENDK